MITSILIAAAVATQVTQALFGESRNDQTPSLYDRFLWARVIFWLLAVVLLGLFVAVVRTAGEV